MLEENKKNRKIMFGIIGFAIFLITLVGGTYAFFNYTRKGTSNTISVGRIAFNSTQNGTINLTNVFPISSTDLGTDVGNHGEVTINVTGDTTYGEGIEYLISFSDVNNIVNGKMIPIKYSVTPTSLGDEATSYWTERGGSTTYYHILDTDDVRDNKYIVVGYIKSGAAGVNGSVVIKAYVDKDDVAITDTPEENTEWQNGRVVLTTEEWNSLATTPLSFKVKVEANEGIWVRESPTPATCFTTNILSEDDHTAEITNYNGGATIRYVLNENLTQEQIDTCTDVFVDLTGGTAEDLEALCDGTGSYQGVTIQDVLSIGMTMPELEESGYIIKIIDENPVCGTDVEIPKTINGYTMVKIADGAYNSGAFYHKLISTVVIPNTVTTIGDNAFSNNQLTNVVIPNSVTTIGQEAFFNNQLTNVVIPNSVTSIGERAFYTNKLTSVRIPNSITSIGSGVFWKNELTSVTIPNSVTTIGARAFADNQLASVEIPNSVTTIGEHTFDTNKLSNLIIPNNVTNIKYGAFNNNILPDNQALIYMRTDTNNDGVAEIDTTTIISYGGSNKDIVIPNTVKTIGTNAFFRCGITNVVLPSNLITIGSQAFSFNQLTNVVIPNSVKTIGRYAFDSNQLISVTIGNSLTSIGEYGFSKSEYSNPNLASITIDKSCSAIKSMSNYAWIGNDYKAGTTIYGANNEVCDAF